MIRSTGGAGVSPALICLAPKKSVVGETPAATVPLNWDGKNHPFDFVDALDFFRAPVDWRNRGVPLLGLVTLF